MRGAEGDAPGLLRVEIAAAERPRRARRGIGRAYFPGQSQGEEYLRRAQDVHAAAGARGAHLAQARGPHHAGARLARRHARMRQAPLGREAGVEARIGCRPGGAQVRGRRSRHGVVRRHHLREDPPGLAASGARDGHMVAPRRGLVDGAQHHGRARRRRAEDGAGQAKPARGMRTSFWPWLAVRVAAPVEDHARARYSAVDGVDLVDAGQRRHEIAHGHREVGMRARADVRHPRGGGAGPVRVHRGRLQQGEDTFGAGLFEPCRVRRGQLAHRRRPPEGGVKGVNGIGVDSGYGLVKSRPPGRAEASRSSRGSSFAS